MRKWNTEALEAKRNKEQKTGMATPLWIGPTVVPSASLSDRQRNRQLIQDPSGAGLPSHGDEEGTDQSANEGLCWREGLSVREEDAEDCCASPRDEGNSRGTAAAGRWKGQVNV